MADKLRIKYILLAFVPDPQQEAGTPVAALALYPPEIHPARLKVYARPGWDQTYPSGEFLQLAKEQLKDWETISPEDAEFVFDDIMDSSLGPLQPEKSGTCTQSELSELLAQELQITI